MSQGCLHTINVKRPITSPPHRNFSPKDSLFFSATEIFSCSKELNAFKSWTDTFMKSSTFFVHNMHSALENFCTPFSIKVAPWTCPRVDCVSAEGARDSYEASDACSVCRRLIEICIMLARNNGSWLDQKQISQKMLEKSVPTGNSQFFPLKSL